ncbi:unnamed protein product [Linum trigynum]|uniref:Reverse transcriptase Ty1/copia-type domain-containing protein n=1 Tax=Linum trigynum TaxID=586398 RepID=A0AAV2GQJ2_9ROSI
MGTNKGSAESIDFLFPVSTEETNSGGIEAPEEHHTSKCEPVTEVEEEKEAPAHIQKRHPPSQIIGQLKDGIHTRGKYQPGQYALVSLLEPRNYKEAITDDEWLNAMQEELLQFARLHVWELVPRPIDCLIIGTKWVFRNKTDEEGAVVKNKARLVAQGYL